MDTLHNLTEIISDGDDYLIPKEILARTDPEFLRISDENFIPRQVVDILSVLTKLYDRGYMDSIKDIQKLK